MDVDNGPLAGAAGFLAGPERMMDVFGMVWKVIGSVFGRHTPFY
jgi:hypothetical protein